MAKSIRARAPAKKPSGRNPLVYWIGGAVVLTGGLFAAFAFMGRDTHQYEVSWPESKPTGDPVRVARALAPGDAFVTTVETKTRIVLESSYADDMEKGMKIDATLEMKHAVEARDGGGTRSTLQVRPLDVSSNVPGRQQELWTVLGDRANPVVILQERDAQGARLPPPKPASANWLFQALALDLLFSGFSDPTLDFLPRGRDVRLGETWKLFDEVSDFPGMDRALRFVADTLGDGYPVLTRSGIVQAEAVEKKGDEDALRLRILLKVSMEGDTRDPAPPGRVAMGGKGEGKAWVSLVTGLPIEMEIETRMRSSLRREGRPPAERNILQTVRAKTVRAPTSPAPER